MNSLVKYFLPLVLGALVLSGCQAKETAGAAPVPETTLHPDFQLSLAEAEKLLTGLPEDLKPRIRQSWKEFLGDLIPLLDQEDLLRRVDKVKALPEGYAPAQLFRLADHGLAVPHREVFLSKTILEPILALDKAAKAQGLKLVYTSAYRSYQTQVQVYNGWVARDGKAAADRYSAQPGRSQHQLGTVVDFGDITEEFAQTPEGKWLKAHAGDYGFSMSFPPGYEQVTGYKWEPWHFRYIGIPACQVQAKYFGGIQQYLLEFLDTQGPGLKKALKRSS